MVSFLPLNILPKTKPPISEKKVEIYVSYLRGRLNYDAKKAARLGFFTIHDYVRDTLTREAEALEKLLEVTLTKTRI